MITETIIPLEDMKCLEKTHLCAECQAVLTIAWGGSFGIDYYVLRCGKNINHSGITRHDKKYEERMREVSMDSKALEKLPEDKMLARVNMARFPQDLTPEDKNILVQVAITYGFAPLMKEISIYQGSPYVSIDGRYRKAQETGELDGVETRPASKQEREDWGVPDEDYFFRAEVRRKNATYPFVGWGRVFKSETTPGSRRQGDTTSTFKPIQSNPPRMAEKRAEAQGLRKGFHIPLPSFEENG